ncbi:UNVERIFIED_CONTAM: hypothetical protein Scaly_0748100 [Sesamum calycinum]|uniref:Uncharacterized protein n=1 Tax=Sesamum calycinum TaxID=2727403 RepID=A0AAW2R819_9LAMI
MTAANAPPPPPPPPPPPRPTENHAFSEGMVDDGYDEVVNIDISSVVIEAMQKKYANRPQLKWTLDSLLCGHNSRQNAGKMLEEVWSTYLKLDSALSLLPNLGFNVWQITYGSPAYRLPLLKDLSWTIKLHVIEKLASGNSSHQTTDVTCPIPLDVNGGSAEAAAGMKADVHYIYVCIKDNSERVKDESPMEG